MSSDGRIILFVVFIDRSFREYLIEGILRNKEDIDCQTSSK